MDIQTKSHIVYPKNADAISIILKLMGEVCNLNCVYCYEKRKPYVGQRMLETKYISMLLDSLYPSPLSIELHGGEPLLYPKSEFAKVFEIIRCYKSHCTVRIQTNGTLLNDAWLEFLLTECPNIEIGISLDGDLEANGHRVDYKKINSYESISKCLNYLSEKDVNIGVIMVVNSINHEKFVNCLSEFSKYTCIKTVKFVPCFDIGLYKSTEAKEWAISPRQYADFLINSYKHWRDQDLFKKFLIEPHFGVIKKLNGMSTINCHYSENKCAYVYTLYPGGLIGSCDEFNKEDSILTNVNELKPGQLVNIFAKSDLVTKLDKLLDKCSKCSYLSTCGGGCLATRKRLHKTDQYEEYCSYRMRFIDFISNEINHVDC
ncbi:radical SAM/SPASM domain-containing protein [Spirosoma foliorum]|uniref:Radical SAM protein n=1 Tax=Spirosoma foliorum TaxID=2710596 RepID=A0A7G5GRG8_9BACT|nr:radical SAM protein [Spirosoma foliorum]QMW01460.1 radical SAM protein [Spirosoma foliorum]